MSPIAPTPRLEIDDCWNKIGVQGDGSCPELERHIHCRNCPTYTGAAEHLLDSSVPADYLHEWTLHYARPKTVVETDRRSLFIFRLGAEWLALPVDMIKEIAPLQPVHRLPHRRNGAILGLTNVRGELLVTLSLDLVLGLEATEAKQEKSGLEKHRLLVIAGEGGPLACPIDEAHGIVLCAARELTEVPATITRATASYSHAVLPWEGRSVGCLDQALLLTALNRSLT